MYKQISIQQLKPGMVIIGITEQNGPVKIRKAGLVTSPEMVQGLAEMGVQALEIDPQQTVELDTTANNSKPSATQQLLNQQGKGQQVDHNLSEQFNRSLFLPSVQDIPSAWQHYMRQGGIAFTMVLSGLALGYTVAKVPQWLNSEIQLVQNVQPKETVEPTPVIPEPATAPQVEPTQKVDTPVVTDIDTTETQATVVADTTDEPVIVKAPEQKVDNSAISPELLQKFQQAVADIKPEEPAEFSSAEQPELQGDEVLRVDQLPAWILTELPSMSFSAHMYASEAQQRWVRVNGVELGEGDWIEDKLRINRIEAQRVILNYRGHEFSMRALTDW